MAHIIKLKNRPYNYFLKNRLKLVPLNQLQKNSPVDRLEQFETSRTVRKNLLKNYLENKAGLIESGFHRSINRYKAKFLVETLVQAIYLRTTVLKEALAINALASKIAGNILNKPDGLSDFFDPSKIAEELVEGLSIQIYAPQIEIELLHEKYERIIKLFSPSEFFVPHSCARGAQIRVNSIDLSFHLDFDDRALDNILNSVLQRMDSPDYCSLHVL